MAVTVISRPEGHKLGITPVEAFVNNDGGGSALFNEVGHGLITGDYVYIESDISSYSGFKYVEISDVNAFWIHNSVAAPKVSYKQDTVATYYKSELNHGWQCVHLPIVYELESDIYPVNSVDTVIPITPNGFVNGYFSVTHAALTGSDELFALDYVNVNGVTLQVVEIVSTTVTVLNSDGSGTFSTMQKVRNNYHVLVNVYAGLPVGHPWEPEKPYELAAELKFIPDSNNRVKFSIAEILKGYITTRNKLDLDTLPNNIDFLTAFYIESAEGYDVSNGTTITAFTSEYADDSTQFQGHAVNAMLAFKNIYSGFMSEYINSENGLARWLHTMPRPMMWVNYFFDISFLNTNEGDIEITKNGDLYLTLTNPGIGILRIPVEALAGETVICLAAYANPIVLSNGVNDGTVNTAWTLGAAPSVTTTTGNSQRILFDYATTSITLPYNLTVTVTGSEVVTVRFSLTDSSGTTDVDFEDVAFNSSGVKTGSVTLAGAGAKIGVKTFSTSGTGSRTVVINSLTVRAQVTEEICIDVVEDCGDTLLNDDLRLIETGPFRELE